MIEIKNLTKIYPSKDGDITALRDINLTIFDKEIFGIIGLSGAGKSTLVRCINFLERPTSGDVIVDGENLGELSTKKLLKTRQNIGMVFQGFNLLEQRNVLRNICYPLEIAGVKSSVARKRGEELLEIVGLSDKAKAYPSQLSGGQKQRVAIARALAGKPKYLLCDEATSALDPQTTHSILELMKKINRTMGVTIIVITHEMKVIDSICDKVAVLDKNVVAEKGFVKDVFSNPKSDIAKRLVMPQNSILPKNTAGKTLRIIYNGESSSEPILANMILECKARVNILHANTENIHNKAYGQMLLELLGDEKDYENIKSYLMRNNINFSDS